MFGKGKRGLGNAPKIRDRARFQVNLSADIILFMKRKIEIGESLDNSTWTKLDPRRQDAAPPPPPPGKVPYRLPRCHSALLRPGHPLPPRLPTSEVPWCNFGIRARLNRRDVDKIPLPTSSRPLSLRYACTHYRTSITLFSRSSATHPSIFATNSLTLPSAILTTLITSSTPRGVPPALLRTQSSRWALRETVIVPVDRRDSSWFGSTTRRELWRWRRRRDGKK